MRKLASIQSVTSIEPIENADAIERIRILGWWVVVKKGEFRLGDRVIYCEIDSLMPERPEFKFLRASSYKSAIEEAGQVVQRPGFRIRTVKLRGQVSQGICFPLTIMPGSETRDIGTDVTEELGVIKYELPLPAGTSGRVKGGFPAFLPKTDEIRVQVLEALLQRHRGTTFYMTEKLDGTSFTAFLRQDEFGLCSRNQWLDESDEGNSLVRLARQIDLAGKLRQIQQQHGFDPAVQGEVIGPGIQKNKYGLKGLELRIFNLVDIDGYRLVDRPLQHAALDASGLSKVPELGELVLNHSVDELVALSIGTSILNSKVQREGIVLRPLSEVFDQDVGGRLSFKVINPQFLLKFDE